MSGIKRRPKRARHNYKSTLPSPTIEITYAYKKAKEDQPARFAYDVLDETGGWGSQFNEGDDLEEPHKSVLRYLIESLKA